MRNEEKESKSAYEFQIEIVVKEKVLISFYKHSWGHSRIDTDCGDFYDLSELGKLRAEREEGRERPPS